MNRRHLLPVGVAALAVALAASLLVPAATGTASARADRPTGPRVAGINIDAKTIPQLERLMNRHRLTSVQLVRFYVKRIHTLNPKLHAVITVNPRAVAQARRADRRRAHGDRRSLLGIPVMVKDNIDTTGMATTAGSLALKGSMPPDAFIVRRLKKHGALVNPTAALTAAAHYR